MRRREFLVAVTGTAVWPVASSAQQLNRSRRIARVGILNYASANDERVDDFRRGLRELGYVDGQNLAVIYRWADGRMDRLPGLAAEVVASDIDVMIAIGPAVWAAKQATTTVPIVIAFSGDPVGDGVVPNLARPGGNITGLSYMSTDLAAKRLELLHEIFPDRALIGIQYNPDEPATAREMNQTQIAARNLGLTLQPLSARNPDELESAFAAGARGGTGAVIVFTHGFAVLNEARIIELAERYRLPTMYGWRDFVANRGLISYGPDIPAMIRRATSYVDRIIKGEKPGDLPVNQPARLELVVNLKTAKALGLTIPLSLLARADEVIE